MPESISEAQLSITLLKTPCPCGHDSDYAECCAPLHQGKHQATSAEQLMRSRYSAFVYHDIDYIVATTLPAQQAYLDKKAISDWATTTRWAGLSIIDTAHKVAKRHAQVEFKAFFHQTDGIDAHHERSTFVLTTCNNNKTPVWYFLDPTVAMSLSQKQPCLCDSGQKFKHCCGQFL